MEFTLLAALGAFITGLALGGYGIGEWKDGQLAKKERDQAKAQQKIDEQAQQLQQQEAKRLADIQEAFDKGAAQSKTVTRTIYVKGQDYVAQTPAVRNPQCVIPVDGVRILDSAIADVRSATAAAAIFGFLPGAESAPPGNPDDGRSVPPVSTGSGGVQGVRAPAPSVDSDGGVPAASVRAHPKPTPAAK